MIREKRIDFNSKKEEVKSSDIEFTDEESVINRHRIVEFFTINLIWFFLESKFKTFIDTLLEANKNDQDFTNADVRDEVITMMFAVKLFLNNFIA